jgi:hypothetical protein
MKLLTVYFSPVSCYFLPLSPKSPSAPYSRTPSAYVLPLTPDTKFHTHTKLQATLQFRIFNLTGRRQIQDRVVAALPFLNSL